MKKKEIKKQTLISSALILGICMVFARFLGIFFRIPVQNLLGDEGMGYFQMSYPIYLLFVSIASGIPIAISKIVSELSVRGNYEDIRRVIRITMLMMVTFAATVTALLLSYSKVIIKVLKWHPNSYYAFVATAIAPVFVIIVGVLRGFFQGVRDMGAAGVSQIIEQIGRVLFGVGLAYILFSGGLQYAAGGAALGTLLGAILAGLYLIIRYIKSVKLLPKTNVHREEKLMKRILINAVPISIGATVGTLMTLIDNIMIPARLLEGGFSARWGTVLIGQAYGKAATLNNVPLALSMALSASIVPVMAESMCKGKKKDVQNKVNLSMKIASLIAIPSSMGLYFMAYPIIKLVFRGQVEGYDILKYFAIALPFIVICQSTTAILQASGYFYTPIKSLFIGCIIKVIVTYNLVVIPTINIKGAVIGTAIGYLVACTLNLINVRKKLKVHINYYEIIIKPSYASVIMIFGVVLMYKCVYNYTISNTVACISSILIGIMIYGILVVVFKVLDGNEIKQKLIKKKFSK